MASPLRLLLTGGRVFDGINDAWQRWDVLIEGDEIIDVAPTIEAEAERLDASDAYLIPGLIDMHVHVTNHGMEALPVFIGNGITTIRDVGGNTARLKQMKLDVEAGKVTGPNIIYSGPLLHEHPARPEDEARGSGPAARPFRSEPEAREAVTQLIEQEGVGSLKIWETIHEPMAQAILEAARGRVPVTGHLARTSSIFAMRHGINGLEHLHASLIRDLAPPASRPDPDGWQATPGYAESQLQAWAAVDPAGPEVEAWLRVFLEHRCSLTPTITVFTAFPRPDDPRLALVPRSLEATMQQADRASELRTAGTSQELAQTVRENQRRVMQLIYQSGGDMVVGTDFVPGKLPGWSHHDEMVAFQRRGIKPIDVLKAATSVAARHLWRSDLGTIAAGKRADLVLLSEDPLASVEHIASIQRVMKSGVVYERSALLAVAEPDVKKFAPGGRI